jgi:thiol:disulfide interchange protein DsbD
VFGHSSRACIGLVAAFAAAGWSQLNLPTLDGFAKKPTDGVVHSLVADVRAVAPGKPFRVGVEFTVPKDAYFYYKFTGARAIPTALAFSAPEGFVVGPVQFPAPEVKHEIVGDESLDYYVYTRSTIVFAEVTPPPDLPPGKTVEIRAETSYQYCNKEGCTPVRDGTLALTLPSALDSEPSDHAKAFARAARHVPQVDEKGAVVKVEADLNVDALRPDSSAKLALELSIEPGYHIQMNQPPDAGLISTEVILDVPDGLAFLAPIYPEPFAPIHPLQGFEHIREYRGRVTVIVPLQAKKYLPLGEATIRGLVRYQACDENGCLPMQYASFSLTAPVVSKETAVHERTDGVFETAGPATRGDSPSRGPTAEPEAPSAATLLKGLSISRKDDLGDSLALYLLYAFLGGMFLNVMPCVLPVIAIKVLGFVNQAGESRGRIFLLNLAYAMGVIGVFFILASLAVFFGLIWGELFQQPEFNLVMAGLVFAMGLSLLGVFDIPVPGFAGSIDTSRREGPLGAFLTGVLATLLATPCSGPFIAVTLGWSVSQPPLVVYAVWGTAGVGMASPYILCSLFPGFIRWLPRPGMWMVRFKELSGFVLMGTVVYIISYLDKTYVVPLLGILLGVAVAVWMIANLYDVNARSTRKWTVRSAALGVAALSVAVALFWLKPIAEERARDDLKRALAEMGGEADRPAAAADASRINWIPFTESNLSRHLAEGRTIFIDFTANWCQVCLWNEANILETERVRQVIDELGVATLKADWTDRSDEIKKWLLRFGGGSLPHYVVISASDPKRPRVFGGTITQGQVVSELRAAGPSKSAASRGEGAAVSLAQ